MNEESLSLTPVYSARPTFRVDGEEITGLHSLLLSFSIEEREGGLSSLEMRLTSVDTDGLPAFEDGSLDFGKEIRVYSGDVNQPREIFRGKITAMEARFTETDPELLVLAEDALQLARWQRRTKAWDQLAASDVIGDAASSASLTPASDWTGSFGPQAQMNETTLGFLRRMLEVHDADAQASADKLQACDRASIKRDEVTLIMNEQLRYCRVVADLAHQVTQVTVSGWDHLQGQKVSATSTDKDKGSPKGKTGAAIMREKFGPRSEHLAQRAVALQSEAQALADAAFEQRARSFLTAHGTAEGNARIRVGTHLRLQDLGKPYDNTYYVRSTCHRWDIVEGYQTDFVAECAFWGGF